MPDALRRIEELEVEDGPGGVELLPGTKELLSSPPAARRLPPAGRWAVVTSVTLPPQS